MSTQPNTGETEFEVIGGIYYNRRLLSKRVNPVSVEQPDDKRILFGMFINYWQRSKSHEDGKYIDDSELLRLFKSDYEACFGDKC